jgi:asparagine synthase (glutamine-hydrolysing)
LDYEAIQLYLKYKNIPAPYSIYKSIKKILPGSYISWQRETNTLTQKYYWNANNIFLEKIKIPFRLKKMRL